MKIYNYEKINECYLYGSLDGAIDPFIKTIIERLDNKKNYKERQHPKEIERQERLMGGHIVHNAIRRIKKNNPFGTKSKLSNCLIVITGNTGFGNKNLKYYTDRFDELNPLLEDNNCHIAILRGSFDDPGFFENETISYSHIKTIPDYSVLKLENFNCLCIGGSISIDREWRKKQEKRTGKRMYWENEGMVYDEKAIEEIIDTMDIACVVTNSSPSFSYPGTNSLNKSSWKDSDKTILEEIQNERKTIDKIYSKFIEKNKKPYVWVYSSFLSDYGQFTNDIYFKSLSTHRLFSFNECVAGNFSVDLKKKLSNNLQAIDKLLTEFQSHINVPHEYLAHADDDEFDGDEILYDDDDNIAEAPNDPGNEAEANINPFEQLVVEWRDNGLPAYMNFDIRAAANE